MYRLEHTKEFYLDNPWNVSYQSRIDKLKEAKKLGKKTVAYLYGDFDSSTFRYRGYNVVETLEYSFYWAGACFEYHNRVDLVKNLFLIDVLIIIRCAEDDLMDEFIDRVREASIPIGYDIDDLVYDLKYLDDLCAAIGVKDFAQKDGWADLMERTKAVAGKCDFYISTNEFLAGYLRADFSKPCYVLHNYLNWYQERVSEEYFRQKQEKGPEKPFEIGYFSGSPTHVKDFMIAMPEIEEFLHAHDDTVLKIVGFMNFPNTWRELVDNGRVRFEAFQPFVDLQFEQAKSDVNVVPLVNNVFSNCKSELKYFECAIVGTITCATPIYTYNCAITTGDNGYICEPGEWFDTLDRIYRMSGDEIRLKQKTIKEAALKEYSCRNQLESVERILNEAIGK